MNKKLKSIPKFRSEADERRFWETRDSSNYVDWNKAERVRLPKLKPSTESISLRLQVTLLERIKVAANKRDVPYQSLIKTWLAEKRERADDCKGLPCDAWPTAY
jgi:predicted DNA binding CopG/RHH family protein